MYRTWESCPLETKRRMEAEMELVAVVSASGSESWSQTSTPWTTASWAIPEPIWPPPTTPMLLISAMASSSLRSRSSARKINDINNSVLG